MPTNETRRELLDRAKASGYPGSITEVFQAADQGIDLIEQHQMQEQQQEMMVAQTPQEQEVGLREEHAAGNTDASMAFPDVQPNQSFNTVGMEAPIDIQKIDDQGHLVESYKNVPPGIQDLPTGPSEGTVIESPAAYQTGGYKSYDLLNMTKEKNEKDARNIFLQRQRYAESTFKPNAVSDAGAMGIAQFMPITIDDMKKKGIVKNNFDPFDYTQATKAQEKWMDYLSKRPYINKGTDEVKLAKQLAGYNMGGPRLKGVLTKMKNDGINIYDDLHWVDKLPEYYLDRKTGEPITETTEYINKILSKTNPRFERDYKKDSATELFKPKRKGGYRSEYQLGGALQNIGAYVGYSDKGPEYKLEPSINILGDACRTGQCFAESDKSLRIGPTFSGANFRMVEKSGVNTDLPGNKSPEADLNIGGKLTYESIFSRGRRYWDHGHFGLEGKGGINTKDKSPFYEGKMKLGVLGRPDWGRYGYGAYAKAGTTSGIGVGGYGRLGPLSGEAGYNFQTQSPEFKIGLGYNFRKGGIRKKCRYGCW